MIFIFLKTLAYYVCKAYFFAFCSQQIATPHKGIVFVYWGIVTFDRFTRLVGTFFPFYHIGSVSTFFAFATVCVSCTTRQIAANSRSRLGKKVTSYYIKRMDTVFTFQVATCSINGETC